jgi:hypothetical protein
VDKNIYGFEVERDRIGEPGGKYDVPGDRDKLP